LSARIDADDVLMSAYRSLFLGLRRGQYRFEKSGDLWRLLVEIALHKVSRQVERHRAARRTVDREVANCQEVEPPAPSASQPSPDVLVEVEDQLRQLFSELEPIGRAVIELRLQGFLIDEIAAELGCAERTVRRHLQRARDLLVPAAESSKRTHHRPASQRGREQPSDAAVGQHKPHLPSSVPVIQFGELTLLKQIGEGGSGKVYLARRGDQAERVAVKFLKKRFWRRTSAIERFLAEARVLSELHHPHIVELRGLGRTPGGGWFLVMDYVDGTDLSRIGPDDPVKPRRAAQWMLDVASAVDFAHQHGVIHCDLKPSNVLLDARGNVRITDFGLALQDRDGIFCTPAAAGTPAFMAPEQVDGKFGPVGKHTDIWGLGGLLYALLYGHPPAVGQNVTETMERLTSWQEIPALAYSGRASLPTSLVQLCKLCLRKLPTNRLRSTTEVIGVLQAYLQSADVDGSRGSSI